MFSHVSILPERNCLLASVLSKPPHPSPLYLSFCLIKRRQTFIFKQQLYLNINIIRLHESILNFHSIIVIDYSRLQLSNIYFLYIY
jgi:hypothetical protein